MSSHLDNKALINYIDATNLVILNDGSGTRQNPSENVSPLNLTLV